MQNIYDALKRLRNRDIEINNEKMWLSIGFVNYVKHIKNKSYFEVQVSKEVLPYYVELAQNFTSYSMTVAIALKSTFSQRFYELCCQYRNAGFFFYTVEKLREMFMLEKKYKRGCDFKRRVVQCRTMRFILRVRAKELQRQGSYRIQILRLHKANRTTKAIGIRKRKTGDHLHNNHYFEVL